MHDLIGLYDEERLSRLTTDRRRTSLRVLRDLVAYNESDLVDGFRALLLHLRATGSASGTLRKKRAIVLAFADWAWRTNHLSANDLLAIRNIRLVGGSRETLPQPYRPTELRQLRSELDARWSKLTRAEADKWLRRYAEGRSPYSRVRSHVIRGQLEAIIALALHLGLRRAEIRSLDIDAAHHDNAYVVVGSGRRDDASAWRAVPFTDGARAAMAEWVRCRHFIASGQRALWLNLHAAPTCNLPITDGTFDRLLGTYVGKGWTLKRLRDTCAAGWVRAGLPLEHVRQMLGLARIDDVLPYARLVGGSSTDGWWS